MHPRGSVAPRRPAAALTALVLLAAPSPAFGPRDLEPRPRYLRNPPELLPSIHGRPKILDVPRPPPPEYAYWYKLKEEEAARKGLRDPWFLDEKRKTEGYRPQPGVALGDAWKVLPRPWPERAGPREIQRLRKGAWPAARISPDPGFRTDDPYYDYHPWDPRSDIRVHARDHGWEGPPVEGDAHRRAWKKEEPRPAAGRKPSREPPDEAAMRRAGARLFARPPSGAARSCASCHRGPAHVGGVFARYPRYDGHVNRIITMSERVNMCRVAHQGCDPFPPRSLQRVALLLHLRDLETPRPGDGE